MSDLDDRNEIFVKWTMQTPPTSACDYFSWKNYRESCPSDLENRLGWPSGTLKILDDAFRLNLTRNTGWKLESETDFSAYQCAARFFRRGVPTWDQESSQHSGAYPIQLATNTIEENLKDSQTIYIFDEMLKSIYKLQDEKNRVFIRLNELTKNLESVAKILEKVRETGVEKPWTIVGGGVLADTAAFAAVLAGKKFRLIPTTLLAMLDACVGGKTGVNFPPFGKNQVGAFAFPSLVTINTTWLQTLPAREFYAGLAEAWKHAVLKGDKELSAKLVRLEHDPNALHSHLIDLVSVKARIVAEDPTENGVRATLNLGHTLAHALERISQKRNHTNHILHGEAVGVGLLFCIDLSHSMGYLKKETWYVMTQQLLNSNIVISPQKLAEYLDMDDLTSAQLTDELIIGIHQDKKNSTQNCSQWILLKDWGEVAKSNGAFSSTVEDEVWLKTYLDFMRRWASGKLLTQ